MLILKQQNMNNGWVHDEQLYVRTYVAVRQLQPARERATEVG